jgi:hypothetical protein
MSKEIAEAAALRLKSKALESYGIIKDLLQQSPHEGVTDKIANQALNLAQLEGAMITLQRYFVNGAPPPENPKVEQPKAAEPIIVTPEMSPTYRRSLEKEKIRKTTKKAKSNDE